MSFILCGAAGTVLGVTAESELYSQAYQAKINKDFPKAARLLEDLLVRYPNTQNEDVYWELKEIYENNLADYGGALRVYQRYQQHFPEGRFAKDFNDRAAYLQKYRNDWEVIRKYNIILEGFYNRKLEQNLSMMESLLHDYPKTSAAMRSDIYGWLASTNFQNRRFAEATGYIQMYLETFPENGKKDYNAINGYKLYSQSLMHQRHYREALTVLRQAFAYNITPAEYRNAVLFIKEDQRTWVGLRFAWAYLALFLGLVVYLKPWRQKNFWAGIKSLPWWLAAAVLVTIGPMWLVKSQGYSLMQTFGYLMLGTVLALLLIRLLAPAATKLGRWGFRVVSFLLVLDAIYISFFYSDTLYIFWTPLAPL